MNEASPLKCLPVQLDELAYALYESSEAEAAHYLDMETDEVIRLTAEMRAEADEISASLEADVENVDAAFEAALAQHDLPDWMVDSVRLANVVQVGYGTRFIAISPVEPHRAYEDMADFIATVTNQRIRERLADTPFATSKMSCWTIRRNASAGLCSVRYGSVNERWTGWSPMVAYNPLKTPIRQCRTLNANGAST